MNKVNTSSRFSSPTVADWPSTIIGTLRAIRTVIWTPPHDERVIHDSVAKLFADHQHPVETPLPETLNRISDVLSEAEISKWPRINAKERLGLFAALMQFTMYLPSIRPYFRADYRLIEKFYTKITTQGARRPVGLDDQLRIVTLPIY